MNMVAVLPESGVLEFNKIQLLSQLNKLLREYETRYELKSEHLEAELTSGRMRETAEVCNWLIAFHTYKRLENGR